MNLSERLRWAREVRGWSAQVLDKAAGLSVGHVAKIESGDRGNPRVMTVAAIATALGASLEWLVFGRGKMMR